MVFDATDGSPGANKAAAGAGEFKSSPYNLVEKDESNYVSYAAESCADAPPPASPPAPPPAVALLFDGRSCPDSSRQAALGSFATVDECAAAATANSGCAGGWSIMWSPTNSQAAGWSCRCCEGDGANGPENSNWQVWKYRECMDWCKDPEHTDPPKGWQYPIHGLSHIYPNAGFVEESDAGEVSVVDGPSLRVQF